MSAKREVKFVMDVFTRVEEKPIRVAPYAEYDENYGGRFVYGFIDEDGAKTPVIQLSADDGTLVRWLDVRKDLGLNLDSYGRVKYSDIDGDDAV